MPINSENSDSINLSLPSLLDLKVIMLTQLCKVLWSPGARNAKWSRCHLWKDTGMYIAVACIVSCGERIWSGDFGDPLGKWLTGNTGNLPWRLRGPFSSCGSMGTGGDWATDKWLAHVLIVIYCKGQVNKFPALPHNHSSMLPNIIWSQNKMLVEKNVEAERETFQMLGA